MKYLLILITFFYCSVSFAQNQPSFNCQKARTNIEKSICSSLSLSKQDSELADKYKSFLKKLSPESKNIAKRMQRLWLKARNKTCTGKETVNCLSNLYREWLSFIKKGVLVAKIPLGSKLLPIASPFDRDTKINLRVIKSEKYEEEKYFKLSIHNGKAENIFHDGSKYDEGTSKYTNIMTHVMFYLAPNGKKHMAFYYLYENFGGRCDAITEEKLIFVNIKRPLEKIKTIALSEADDACGTYHNELFKWQVSDDGSLDFLELDNYSFYYQQRFTEIKATNINQNKISESYWIDTSKESFMGTPYAQIMKDTEKGIWGLNKSIKINGCTIPGNGLSDYWRFKEILSYKKIGFNQILYFAHNILQPNDLKTAAQYKPLLESALMYLDKAREIPDWKIKIVDATEKYPQIQATSNFYFDGKADWKVNPFIQSGFYTDVSCYAKARSPFGYASTEEWFYMFWARRVKDGTLNKSENLLKLLINMMKTMP